MKPRVLIVGTVPYNPKSTSRAFASYFGNWEKNKIRQIFSNTEEPVKGHCSELYQITDARMLKKLFKKSITVGKRYSYDDLSESTSEIVGNGKENGLISALYKMGRKKTPFIYLMRHIIWKKKNWNTKDLNDWLDDFNPECVFLSFSDDFFIPEIALYIAKKYNIPIVSSIGDDYYFNDRFSISPFYYVYRGLYKNLIRRVFNHGGGAIYIGDKIKHKYNSQFGLKGKTVYLTSEIKGREFRPINSAKPAVSYFGNIGGGRNKSLCDIANALKNVDKSFKIDVYSNEKNEKLYKCLIENNGINFHGSIPYSEVLKKMNESDVLLVVEGFDEKDIFMTRYSLSTKVADSLSSGVAVFGYGSEECGAIEYLKSIECATVCTDKCELENKLKMLINSEEYQKDNYDKTKLIVGKNHEKSNSLSIFENYVEEVVRQWKAQI